VCSESGIFNSSTVVRQSLSWLFSIDTFQDSKSSLIREGYELTSSHNETEPRELFNLMQESNPIAVKTLQLL